jgi:predicted AlkP superfamily pyrophosphatase or phosphodiesterase
MQSVPRRCFYRRISGIHEICLALLAFAVCPLSGSAASDSSQPTLLLISIDGLRPDYISEADQHGLKIPVLRRLFKEGARASGVKGVLPSSTYPSHTTIITGVAPAKHGIFSNHPFDSEIEGLDVWYYYSEDIRVPTLWAAATAAGYAVGNVSWPVSVGASSIRYNIPEYTLTRSDEDMKLTRATATPGLMQELSTEAGAYLTDSKKAVARDWARARYALAMIRQKQPRFMTVHFASTDHFQHQLGPFTPAVNAALEEIDQMIGQLVDAMHAVDPRAVICIVSDHGFSPVSKFCYLDAAFVAEGLVTLKAPGKSIEATGISKWIARTWPAGGSAAIVLKNPQDPEARAKVKSALDRLAAEPANGIVRIFDEAQIQDVGGTSTAQFWVDLKPGFQVSTALDAKLLAPSIVASVSGRGTHGYTPDHREMDSTFILSGPGIRTGYDLARIDMRGIAPTLAKVMGLTFPSAEAPALDVFATDAH